MTALAARRRMFDTASGPRAGWTDPDDEKTPLASLFADSIAIGHKYSFKRAIGSAMRTRGAPDGLEGEVSAEFGRQIGRSARGFWVPWHTPLAEKRALDTTTGAGSVATALPPRTLIDILRPKLVVNRLGGRISTITAARGNVQIPYKTSATTGGWIAESAPALPANMTIENIILKPHMASVYTVVSRRMLSLAQADFEDLVVDDLMVGLAVKVDGAALVGGGPNEPLGLLSTAGIPSLPASGALTYAHLVAMQEAAAVANADTGLAKMGWLTSPQGRATLALTDMSTTGQGRFCWKSSPMVVDGEVRAVESVLGQNALSSTLVPSSTTTSLVHGDFARCWVNVFAGIDILVDPYYQSTAASVRIFAYIDVDVAFPSPTSFITCPNVTPIAPT